MDACSSVVMCPRLFLLFLSLSYSTLWSSYESNPSAPLILRPPSLVSCSESVLELSIMPKDEDVLQLVSAGIL